MRKLSVVAASMLGFQALAAPAQAAEAPMLATGTYTVTSVSSVELVPAGQQCVAYVEDVVTFTGTLAGTSETVSPAEVRFFATCDELVAAGFSGIRSTFHAVEHLVLLDGTEATLVSVGGTDTEGNFQGTSTLRGGLHGVLHTAGVSGQSGTYEGQVIRD